MMNKLTISSVVTALVLLTGAACSTQVKTSVSRTPVTSEASPAQPTTPNPVSLAALMAKQFDGRNFTVGKVLDSNTAYTRYYITYKSGQLTISGIMNVPNGRGPFPILVLNHGHIDTAIYTNGRGLKREQDYLARQGFVVIHPDFRNHAESDKDPEAENTFRLGYVEDSINAVYAIRAAKLPYMDTGRVGMLGHSMGGGITQSVLVVAPDLVKAAVLYAPVSGDYKDNYERYTKRRPELLQSLVARYGSLEANPGFWAGISASSYYSRIKAPVQIHIGTQDESVEEAWSYTIRDRLQALGKDVTLYEYQGEHHEFGPQWTLFMQRTAEFFKKHL